MGLIRISDEAEAKIKELAAGRTVTSTVDTLVQSTDVAARLNKMAAYLEKEFDSVREKLTDLEAAIDLISVSPSASNKRRRQKKIVPFDTIQELIFDYLEDNAPEWFPQAEEGAHASDYLEMNTWYTDGETISSDGPFGYCEWLKVSERIESFLKERGVECTL